MDAHVRAEWEPLTTVAMHRPGMEMFFGLLDPYASLYDRAFPQDDAVIEHEHLEEILHHEFGITVVQLKAGITSAARGEPLFRDRLVGEGRRSIRFTGDREESRLASVEFLKNIPAHDPGFFFDLLLMNPEIRLSPGPGEREIDRAITSRQPLSNLYFMRDQQIVTGKGIVMGNMAKPQRAREPVLTRMLWDFTGTPVAGAISGTGTFEGGDFMPMRDFALIGTGDRTNREGVDQFLASRPGIDEIGIVSPPVHPLMPAGSPDPMVAMHLDTWFNVASSGTAIGSEVLMRNARVRVLFREGDRYREDPAAPSLYDYIRGKGFDVIDITTLEQMSYAPNFLCIRENSILAVEVDRIAKDVLTTLSVKAGMAPDRYGDLFAQAQKDYGMLKAEGQFFPHKKELCEHDIDAHPIRLRNLTGGYGAARCLTCPVRRG